MSNVHDNNVILVGRMEALSEDHKRVCTENSELKNQVKALKNEIATNQFSNYVFTKQELIDLIMRQAIAWAKKFDIKIDTYKTEGTKTALILDSEEIDGDLYNKIKTTLQSEISREIDQESK